MLFCRRYVIKTFSSTVGTLWALCRFSTASSLFQFCFSL